MSNVEFTLVSRSVSILSTGGPVRGGIVRDDGPWFLGSVPDRSQEVDQVSAPCAQGVKVE